MNTKFLAAIAAATLGFAIPASAADLPVRTYTKAPAITKAPAMAPVVSWAGFYVGAHVGYAWGQETDNLSDMIVFAFDKFDVKGVIGGVHAGYNWQTNGVVFGIEGDFDGSGVDGDISLPSAPDPADGLSMKSKWQASFRARLGFAADDFLIYGTGGIALTDVKSELTICTGGTCSFNSGTNTLVGWTAGLGLEKMFSPNWTGRVEVRYTDFGSKTFSLTDQLIPTVAFKQTSGTVGVSYKF